MTPFHGKKSLNVLNSFISFSGFLAMNVTWIDLATRGLKLLSQLA